MAKDVIAPKKRRLSDLFVVGEELTFDDGQGEPITVWVQKLTPDETQIAVDEARPAKAKITAVKRAPEDHPAKLRYVDELESKGIVEKMDLIKFIIRPKVDEAYLSAQSRIAHEKEWQENDYLDGLQTAWNEEMKERWLTDPEGDEDAIRVYEELKRYTDQVNAEAEAAEQELIYELDDLSLEALQRRAVNALIEDHGDHSLVNEFRRRQLFYSVREAEDHSKRYFVSPQEINTLPSPVLNKLYMTYAEISVDTFEGKD